MNESCAAVERDVDEFELAGLTPAPSRVIDVPRVAETPVSFECRLSQVVRLTGADGKLRDRTSCVTVMGAAADVDVVAMRVEEGDTVNIEGVSIKVMYTPGHTRDSYSFLWGDKIFTGDALLIRGTGRTDCQNGSPGDSYESLINRLLNLPDGTVVYPGHDDEADSVGSIGQKRAFKPPLTENTQTL